MLNTDFSETAPPDLPADERPSDRLRRHGVAALSDAELLSLFLPRPNATMDAHDLARKLLQEAGSLGGLTQFSRADFESYPGVGKVRALQLTTLMEVVRRVWEAGEPPQPVLDSPDKVADFMRSRTFGLEVEKFWVLALNTKNRLVRAEAVTSGTATASLVHPREVFRPVIRYGATGVICVHNHPSGDPAPSRADIRVTRQLREAAETLDIDLLDHIVIGDRKHDPQSVGYYSFREAGIL